MTQKCKHFFNSAFSYSLPPLPEVFIVTTMSPSSFEGKGGIKILQSVIPGHNSRIQVTKINAVTWDLMTENVRRFSFYSIPTLEVPLNVIIDGTPMGVVNLPYNYGNLLQIPGSWTVYNGLPYNERTPEQFGPIRLLWEGPVTIIYGTLGSFTQNYIEFAIWIANRMYYQIRSTFKIISDKEALLQSFNNTNLLVLGGSENNVFYNTLEVTQVTFSSKYIQVSTSQFSDPLTGISFVWKLGTKNVAVVVDGLSEIGFKNAALTIPIKSGTTVPDFVVTGPKFGYSGAAGLAGLGYWDSNWSYNNLVSYIDPFLSVNVAKKRKTN